MSNSLLLTPLLLLAACAGSDIISDYDDTQADGYSFVRELEPAEIELNGDSLESTFQDERYIAHEFTIDAPNTVRIYGDFGWHENLENIWDVLLGARQSYTLGYAVFAFDETEVEEGLAAWDLLQRVESREASFELQAGRYMVITLASPEAYDDEATVYTEFTGTSGEVVAPGALRVRLVVDTGADATGVRVGVGTQSGVTDQRGSVLLENLPRGEFSVKFGAEGLGALAELDDVWIQGNGVEQSRVAVISEATYWAWTQ